MTTSEMFKGLLNKEGPSINENVISISKELIKELNYKSPFCSETKRLKEIYLECHHATLLSMLISIFYLWMFCFSSRKN